MCASLNRMRRKGKMGKRVHVRDEPDRTMYVHVHRMHYILSTLVDRRSPMVSTLARVEPPGGGRQLAPVKLVPKRLSRSWLENGAPLFGMKSSLHPHALRIRVLLRSLYSLYHEHMRIQPKYNNLARAPSRGKATARAERETNEMSTFRLNCGRLPMYVSFLCLSKQNGENRAQFSIRLSRSQRCLLRLDE